MRCIRDKYLNDSKKITYRVAIYLFFLFMYIVISLLLLQGDRGEPERWIRYFWANSSQISENISSVANYKQYFYAPRTSTGIAISMSTNGQIVRNDLVFEVYDADSDILVGSQIIPAEYITDETYLSIIFDGYKLEEGKHYYFQMISDGGEKNEVAFGLGTPGYYCYDNLLLNGEVVDDQVIVFNLYCDYTGSNFVLWMFLTALAMYGYYKLQRMLCITKTRLIQALLWMITLISVVGIVIVYSEMI